MNKIKMGLMAGTVLIAGALQLGAAHAADMNYPQAGRDWSGVYVGGFVGAAAGEMFFFSDDTINSASGVTGGLQLGYDYDMGDFVVGIVGDVAITDMSGAEPEDVSENPHTYNTDFLASVRGRLGLDLGDSLVFVSGGAGWINGRMTSSSVGRSFRYSEIVPVVGIGAEHMVTEKMSVAIEGLWFIASETLAGDNGGDSTESRIDDVFTARIGVNIKF